MKKALANAGWKAKDDYTFEVTFTGPFQYAVVLMAFPSFFPVNEKAFNDAGAAKDIKKYGTSEKQWLIMGLTKLLHGLMKIA